MQRQQLRFGVIPFTMPTISPLPAARQLHPLVLLMVALTICAGCTSSAEKPAPPPPGVTITPAILKDVPIHQEWVGTMSGNMDADSDLRWTDFSSVGSTWRVLMSRRVRQCSNSTNGKRRRP